MVGEKKHEMLISHEETTRLKDLGEYFEISSIPLSLPYGAPYTSEITSRLSKKRFLNYLMII